MAPRLLLLASLVLFLGACPAPPLPLLPPPPPTATAVTSSAPAPTPCELATVERKRLAGLLEAGKLHRTLRVIAKANALCPGGSGPTRGLRFYA